MDLTVIRAARTMVSRVIPHAPANLRAYLPPNLLAILRAGLRANLPANLLAILRAGLRADLPANRGGGRIAW